MTPLLRYWLLPGRLRRLPLAGKLALTLIALLVSAGVAVILLRDRQYAHGNGPL